MVDPCDPNVVDGPFSWHSTRSVYLGRGFLDYFRHPDAPPVKKAPSQISYPLHRLFARVDIRVELRPVVQKSPVKARLSNLIYSLRNAACWRCLGIDGYVVQEAAVLLLEFLQLKRPVSLGWGNGPLFSLGLWIGEGGMLWQLF